MSDSAQPSSIPASTARSTRPGRNLIGDCGLLVALAICGGCEDAGVSRTPSTPPGPGPAPAMAGPPTLKPATTPAAQLNRPVIVKSAQFTLTNKAKIAKIPGTDLSGAILAEEGSQASLTAKLPAGVYSVVVHSFAKDDEHDAFLLRHGDREQRIWAGSKGEVAPHNTSEDQADFLIRVDGTRPIEVSLTAAETEMIVDRVEFWPVFSVDATAFTLSQGAKVANVPDSKRSGVLLADQAKATASIVLGAGAYSVVVFSYAPDDKHQTYKIKVDDKEQSSTAMIRGEPIKISPLGEGGEFEIKVPAEKRVEVTLGAVHNGVYIERVEFRQNAQ